MIDGPWQLDRITRVGGLALPFSFRFVCRINYSLREFGVMAKKSKKKSKKASKKKANRASTVHTSPPLDAKKVKEIQSCLKKGQLKIQMSHVDLGEGKLGGAWLYD